DNLTILGIVLIPGVVARLAGASDGDGRDETEIKALLEEEVSQRAVVIAGGFKADPTRRAAAMQESGEALEVGFGALDLEMFAHTGRQLNKNVVAQFGDIDSYPNRRLRGRTALGHSGCAPSKRNGFRLYEGVCHAMAIASEGTMAA